jgi:hypothetical protein
MKSDLDVIKMNLKDDVYVVLIDSLHHARTC